MKKFLALTLVLSVFGLYALMLFANYYQPAEIPIILLQEHLDSEVIITGKVISASHSNETSFLKIRDETAEIRVVVFDNCEQIKKNAYVSVKGTVDIYQGKLEIIANEIKLVQKRGALR